MRFLLDTHTFMWWDSTPDQIPARTLSLLKQPENELLLSLASVWEIQIKTHLGKLELQASLTEIIQRQQAENGIRESRKINLLRTNVRGQARQYHFSVSNE